MHGKESVIAPVMEKEFNLQCHVPAQFDTDRFGMFAGKIRRRGTGLDALRSKCETALREYDTDLVIASEGSFGAHPEIGFVHCNEELLMLVDRKHNLEIIVSELSLHMHYHSSRISSENDFQQYLKACDLPNHALVLSTSDGEHVVKGVRSESEACRVFSELRLQSETVLVESDLRAMHNPTRMAVIGKAARKLADKMKSCCIVCGKPGYGIVDVVSGLPCEDCSQPTKSPMAYVYRCQSCGMEEQRGRIDKVEEHAGFCDFCNP